MRLLVSVSDAAEAAAALEGGADIIDAKDPAAGPLGAVSLDALRDISALVSGRRPLTAALGDAIDEPALAAAASAFAAGGASYVKVGFDRATWAVTERLLRCACHAAARADISTGVIGVAYIDTIAGDSLSPEQLTEAAASVRAAGILLDTSNKQGPSLRTLCTDRQLGHWVRRGHAAGLIVALAGRITAVDLPFLHATGADIVGVRGAACEGGRTGRVTVARVRHLSAVVENSRDKAAASSSAPQTGTTFVA